MGQTTLTTERMTLRPPTMNDVDLLVELDSDPEVMRYLTGGVSTPREEIETDILPFWLELGADENGYGFWMAETDEEGFVGWFHMRPKEDDPPDQPELGYRLRRAVWGRGLAVEGSDRLTRHAFDDLGARVVYAETMVANTASQRVMEKLGMTRARFFMATDWDPIPGSEHGDVRYEMTREDWAKRPRSARLL